MMIVRRGRKEAREEFNLIVLKFNDQTTQQKKGEENEE